jgi:predicted Zn-dependent protease
VAGDDDEVGEARRILDRLIETAPEHPSLPYWSYFRGAVSTRQGGLEEAAECARRTVELQPRFFLAAVMLANALGALGREEEARSAWQRVQAIHPAFTAEGYAREIALQAPQPERAEPHLAGLRAAGILVTSRHSGAPGPEGSAGRTTADPSAPDTTGAPRDDGGRS